MPSNNRHRRSLSFDPVTFWRLCELAKRGPRKRTACISALINAEADRDDPEHGPAATPTRDEAILWNAMAARKSKATSRLAPAECTAECGE